MMEAASFRVRLFRIISGICIVVGVSVYLSSKLEREIVNEDYYIGTIKSVHTVALQHTRHWKLKVKLPGRNKMESFTLLRPPTPKEGMEIPINQYMLDDGTEVLTIDIVRWQTGGL